MELIFSGFGGQGVLTAGLIVAYAGNETGKKVLWSPSYGSEMRGGTANCHVTISDEDIGSPSLSACDALIAMNEPSLEKFARIVRTGGCIVVNRSIVPAHYDYPEGVGVHGIHASELSEACGNKRGMNLVMLGALCRVTRLFTLSCIIKQMTDYFAEKGIRNPLNAECLQAGYEQVGV